MRKKILERAIRIFKREKKYITIKKISLQKSVTKKNEE